MKALEEHVASVPAAEAAPVGLGQGRHMVLNMGPQHPPRTASSGWSSNSTERRW